MFELGLSTTGVAVILASGGPAAPPYPPPSGYSWEAVTEVGAAVAENGDLLLELVEIAA